MTKMVRLIKDFENHKAGTILTVQNSYAEHLVKIDVAVEFRTYEEPTNDKMIRHSTNK